MGLRAVLDLCGILAPRKENVQGLLRYMAETLESDDIGGIDALRRDLPLMSAVHGFFVDIVSLLSSCLHSQNRTMAIATLEAVEVIVSRYDKKLGPFSATCLLNNLLLCPKQHKELQDISKNLFFKVVGVTHNYSFHPLGRLMAMSDEALQLEIIVLLVEHVINERKLNRVVVTECCEIATEGLQYPSSAQRLAAFDLVYALYYRGTPKDVLVRFFEKRNAPEDLVHAIRVRLDRRCNPIQLSAPTAEDYASDPDLIGAEDATVVTDYHIQMTSVGADKDTFVVSGTAACNETSARGFQNKCVKPQKVCRRTSDAVNVRRSNE